MQFGSQQATQRTTPAKRSPVLFAATGASSKQSHGRSVLWETVTALWALYYFAIFTLGRYPEQQQRIIWGGAICLSLMTLYLFIQWKTGMPREVLLLAGLTLWACGGLLEVQDLATFLSYIKLIIEMACVVFGVSFALTRSGSMQWFYWAFVAAGAFNVLVGLGDMRMGALVEAASLTPAQGSGRLAGLNANPNSLGFYCFMGVVGALALFGDKRSLWIRGTLVGGAAICCYGIVASASKGAFLSSFLAIFLWPVFCFREKLRRQWTVLIIIVALALPVALGIHWTMQNTVMGTRLQNGMHREDGSTQTRLKLSLIGLRLCLERPIFGWGLGQFPTASGTGMYAHNEWAELLGTTGVIGFLLYMSVYATAWKRLTKAVRRLSKPSMRYHVNMARLIVILLVVSGALFRPNFLSVDSMFLIGLTVGAGQWAASHARKEMMEKSRRRALRARWVSLAASPQPLPSVPTHNV